MTPEQHGGPVSRHHVPGLHDLHALSGQFCDLTDHPDSGLPTNIVASLIVSLDTPTDPSGTNDGGDSHHQDLDLTLSVHASAPLASDVSMDSPLPGDSTLRLISPGLNTDCSASINELPPDSDSLMPTGVNEPGVSNHSVPDSWPPASAITSETNTHGSLPLLAPSRTSWPVFTWEAASSQDATLIRIYDAVRSTGVPNYQQARIPLPHALNMTAWRHHLADYHDTALCDFLEYGWPMNFVSPVPPTPTTCNHGSATAYVQHVRDYLQKETQLGALLGPFEAPPFSPWFQVNPLMTAAKKDTASRRIITDLSWPPGASVNAGIPRDQYLGSPYKLRLPTVDDMVALMLKHGPGCYMYSVDLARAYRQLRCDPLDWPLLGSQCDNLFYCDTAICFGCRWGAMACQRTTSGLCHIMHKHGHDCLTYIDDLAGAAPTLSAATLGFTGLRSLMQELGLDESDHKAIFPCQQMIWIGVQFDSLLMQISMPQHKIDETLSLCRAWHTKRYATRSQLQQLLGKLFHIGQCCKPVRLFVSRMLDTLRKAPAQGSTALDSEFQKDLEWFLSFLPLYNGVHLIQSEPDICMEVDSCLSGCGGICNNELYHTTFPDFILQRGLSISQLEMLNLAVGIKVWSSASWSNHCVLVYCDNAATIAILQSGRGRDQFMLACARQIWHYSARFDFRLVPRHRAGIHMTASDALSRYHLGASHRARVHQLINKGYTRREIDPYLFRILE